MDPLLAERQCSHAFAASSRAPGEQLLQCSPYGVGDSF